MANAPGLPGRYEHLRNEWPGAIGTASTPVPDAPEPDAQVIVADHDAGAHELAASRTASAIVGRTRARLSPGIENDHGSPPDSSKIRAGISFGSTLSAHAVISVLRSMRVHSNYS
ncbi:MAG TPA: hypothetical protein VGJ20_06405 [Xanthobacteraceae bacterium]|jgi:hypothetical protein